MDGTENQQDNPVVETSVETKGTSEQPKTFTEEQVKEVERKAKSDTLAEVGRLKASTEAAIQAAQKAQAKVDKMIQDQDDAEMEEHKDNKPMLDAITERRKRRLTEAKLDETVQELDGEKAKTKEAQEADAQHTKEQNAREVATRLGVDAKTLIKFTDGSVEAMEDLAKSLPKKGEPRPPLVTDSGKTIGGGEMPDSARGKIRAGWDELYKK